MPIIRKLTRIHNTYTLSVPPEIRHFLEVKAGDYLVWTINKDKRVIVEKLTPKKYPGFFIPGAGWVKREK